LERRGEQIRVEFRCGQRALADYGEKHQLLSQLSSEFTTGYWNLPEVVGNLRTELAEKTRLLREQRDQLLAYEAIGLLKDAQVAGKARIVTRAFSGREPEELRTLANLLIARPGVVALLGLASEKSRLIFARADDAPGKMNNLLKQALPVLGNAGGGGSDSFAQGGGPAASPERVRKALKRAEKFLLGQLT
jgi:alanyl-tRNA synthetase